jgi:hypothetical protein
MRATTSLRTQDAHLVIIARTDAVAVEELDDAPGEGAR